jgi:fatty acyl-CoA reductase
MLEREEPVILKKFGFPNTYTLTKNLAEQAFKRYHGDIRLTISRPSAVTSTYKYPFPGWTDSIAAGGAVIFMLGMGISHQDLVYDHAN